VCKRLIRKITGLKPQAKRRAAAKPAPCRAYPKKGKGRGREGKGSNQEGRSRVWWVERKKGSVEGRKERKKRARHGQKRK